MKKFTAIAISAILLFCTAACGKSEPPVDALLDVEQIAGISAAQLTELYGQPEEIIDWQYTPEGGEEHILQDYSYTVDGVNYLYTIENDAVIRLFATFNLESYKTIEDIAPYFGIAKKNLVMDGELMSLSQYFVQGSKAKRFTVTGIEREALVFREVIIDFNELFYK